MPYGVAQSLSYDETYEIVAYILYMGDIIEEDFVLSEIQILVKLKCQIEMVFYYPIQDLIL